MIFFISKCNVLHQCTILHYTALTELQIWLNTQVYCLTAIKLLYPYTRCLNMSLKKGNNFIGTGRWAPELFVSQFFLIYLFKKLTSYRRRRRAGRIRIEEKTQGEILGWLLFSHQRQPPISIREGWVGQLIGLNRAHLIADPQITSHGGYVLRIFTFMTKSVIFTCQAQGCHLLKTL